MFTGVFVHQSQMATSASACICTNSVLTWDSHVSQQTVQPGGTSHKAELMLRERPRVSWEVHGFVGEVQSFLEKVLIHMTSDYEVSGIV